MVYIEEKKLREKTCDWIFKKYRKRIVGKPVNLHELKLTVTEYLCKRFTSDILRLIPSYEKMDVEPDILALIRLKCDLLSTVIAECKVDPISVRDLRQALDYARVCRSFQAYLIYFGHLTRPVIKRLRSDDITYSGYNDYGNLTIKRLILVRYYGDNTFKITRL